MKIQRRSSYLVLLALVLLALPLMACDSGIAAITSEPVFAEEAAVDGESDGDGADDADAIGAVAEEGVIVVTSGKDPDTSTTKTCSSVAANQCTLRRAIVQANKTGGQVIVFNIPKTAAEGYNNGLRAWVLKPQAGSGSAVYPVLTGGDIEIYGSSQGDNGTLEASRGDGPLIILLGPGNGAKDGLIVGRNNNGNQDANIIEGIAFQNFSNHLVLNSSGNEIFENWFGLSGNGEDVFLRGNDPKRGSGDVGVTMTAGVTDNVIEMNSFLGFIDVAVKVAGQENTVLENRVGTNSDGQVPGLQLNAGAACGPGDWLGGGGIEVAGTDNYIEGNTLVGLHQINADGSQPDAISVSGQRHQVADNFIGMDEGQNEPGVCGRGIVLVGPKNVALLDNSIINTARSAILLNGANYNGNELTGSLIRRQQGWSGGETAVQMGSTLPQALKDFAPAQITEISGMIAKGKSGPGSKCPRCTIQVFFDDRDNVKETILALDPVTADANGNWQVDLGRPITTKLGLRTMSTSAVNNTIPGMSKGTTTGLSGLYLPEVEEIFHYMPIVLSKWKK